MPLYEYRCKVCGHRFEKIQTFSAPDEKECPVCQGEVERLISAPAVHFSGSGFYSTDYKASPAPPRPSGDSSSSHRSEAGKGKDSSASASGEGASKSSSDSSSPAPSASAPAAPASSSSKE